MKPSARNALVTLAFAVVAVLSYVGGVAVGQARLKEAVEPVLASVQADLALTHLQRSRELESDLARGCHREALAKVRSDVHTQMYVLASLYQRHKGTWIVEGIAKRDPSMPGQLEQFRDQSSSLKEPQCTT